MMRDHGAANKNLHDLGIKANIPFDSTHTGDGDPKPEMVEDASDKLDDLRKLQGTDFDKGYMKAEMDRHEDLLKKIDKDLIPHAIHLDLRGFLEKLRPTVVAHLERATMLKNELDRGAVPGTR
jgi:putative membrane protein